MRNFRNFNIWKKGIEIVVKTYKMAALLPKDELYGLKSQTCRASISVPSNIAEGCSRNSEVEFKRFLEISLGSAFELETQLIIIQKLELSDKHLIEELMSDLHEEQKMINGLIETIKNQP